MVLREDKGHYLLCRVSGMLNGRSTDSDCFLSALQGFPRGRDCVLDVSSVTYMGSLYLGTLFHFYDMQRARGNTVILIVNNDSLQSLMALVGMTKIMHIADTLAEAEALLEVANQPDIPDTHEDIDFAALEEDIEQIIADNTIRADELPSHRALQRLLARHRRSRPKPRIPR